MYSRLAAFNFMRIAEKNINCQVKFNSLILKNTNEDINKNFYCFFGSVENFDSSLEIREIVIQILQFILFSGQVLSVLWIKIPLHVARKYYLLLRK